MGVYRNIAILMGKHTVFHHWILGLILGQTHFGPTSEGEFIGETIEHIFDVATVAVGTLRCILEPQKWDWPATKWGFNNILRILCTHVGHILGCAAQLVSGLEPTPLRLVKIFHIYLDNFIDCPLTGMQPKVFLIFVAYTLILSILVCEPPSTRMIAQALPGPSLPGT